MMRNISATPAVKSVSETVRENGFFRSISVPTRLRIAATFGELQEQVAAGLPKRAFFVTGRRSGALLGCELAASVGTKNPLVITDNTIKNAERVVSEATRYSANILVGVGGGKVVDVCKYAAHLMKLPFYSIPTQISHDGIGSPVAVLRVKARECHRSLGASMPNGIFVPLFTVIKAPMQSILSGIGDLLSNLSAIDDWRLAQRAGRDKSDDYAMMVSRTASRMMYFELLSHLPKHDWVEPGFVINLTEGLVLSGIAMEIAGSSRPCSGSEHMISHAMEELFGGIAPHGLQVGFGTVVALFLQQSLGELERIKNLFRAIGIPTRPSDLGLSFDQFARIMSHAKHTRPNRYTILDETALDPAFLRKLYGVLELG
jgi:glycerol-1-phosphate dehydrogenase [NAD(P)+]